jgi:hypothetical protein
VKRRVDGDVEVGGHRALTEGADGIAVLGRTYEDARGYLLALAVLPHVGDDLRHVVG